MIKEKSLVRIIETTLKNFKDISYENTRYFNRSSVERNVEIISGDINGIYEANGSGKTAVVESLDMPQHILCGESAPFGEYGGTFSDSEDMRLGTVFSVKNKDERFKVAYDLKLRKSEEDKHIQIQSEQTQHWIKGTTWKEKHEFFLINSFYDSDSVISNEPTNVTSSKYKIRTTD